MSDLFLGGRLSLHQPDSGFRAGLDAVMLAASVPARAGHKALELGSGAGAASLCVAARVGGVTVVGLEIGSELVALAAQNAAENGFKERVHFIEGDVFAPPAAVKMEFDQVFANPPFHGEGHASPDPSRALALMDGGHLGGWLQAGLKRTVSGGTFTAIVRADRAGEALAALPPTGIILFPFWPREGVPASRVILRAIKGSAAAFVLCRGLVLHTAGGSYTPEADAILRDGAALALDFGPL